MRSDTAKILVTAICLLTAACDDRSESATTPAPKPEVWGTILPVPDGEQVHHSQVYETPSGEVIVSYETHLYPASDDRTTTTFYNFTKGVRLSRFSKRILSEESSSREASQRTDNYVRFLGLREINSIPTMRILGPEAGYRDSHGYTYYSESVHRHNCPPYQGHVEKVDPQGRTAQKLALVQVTRLPRINRGCPEGDPILGLYRVSAPSLDFYALGDGTLLLLAFEDPMAVRLRPDLTSPYIDESDELLWFDADIFAHWIKECRREAYDFEQFYSNAAKGIEDPSIIYHALPTFETTDTCLALRLTEKIGEKRARAQP